MYTKKDELIKMFQDAIEYKRDFVAVAVETTGSEGIEVIINPRCNFYTKMKYYDNAYDDDLVLKSFNGIRIIGACRFDTDCEIRDIMCALKEDFDIWGNKNR